MGDEPAKILLVDDEETILAVFERMLRAARYSVVTARDGVEALDKFDKFQPDLVVLDLMMPRMNGLQTCAHLHHNDPSHAVPILMLSGIDQDDARAAALKLGVHDFLAKPVPPDLLLARIQTLLQVRFGLRDVARLRAASGTVRQELTQAMAQLDRTHQYLQTHPDAQLTGLIVRVLASCKQLDLTLARL